MKILAMDSAAQACSVAIWQDTGIIAHEFQEMARGHASDLLPMVDRVLAQAQLNVTDMDAIAVTVGPGGFTGLRIALACARGFGVAAKLPVIGITTLEALASAETGRSLPLLTALDAKRADLYAQYFAPDNTALSEPVAQMPEDIVALCPPQTTEVLIAGDCFERLELLFLDKGITPIKAEGRNPDAKAVAMLASERGLPDDVNQRPSAFYIRPPDAALPKNGGRLRP